MLTAGCHCISLLKREHRRRWCSHCSTHTQTQQGIFCDRACCRCIVPCWTEHRRRRCSPCWPHTQMQQREATAFLMGMACHCISFWQAKDALCRTDSHRRRWCSPCSTHTPTQQRRRVLMAAWRCISLCGAKLRRRPCSPCSTHSYMQ